MAQISLQTLTDYWKKMANAVDAQDNMFMMKSMQQKWRDSFGGASIDATKWDTVTGSGASLTVSGGQLTMASGTTINADTYILSKAVFTVPFKFSIGFTLSQRIANQTFYVEMVSVDPTTGIPDGKHCCGLIFDGTTATQAKYRVQNSSITPLDSALSTFPTTASGSFYEIEPFSDEVWFHGGTLDSTNGRANSYRRHQQIPDPNAVYKVRLRWINGGSAPASSTSAVIQYVACQDYAELTAEITSGRGNAAVGQAIAVQVLNTAAISGTVTANPTTPTSLTTNAAASTNATSVKASAGTVYSVSLSNQSAAIKYFKIYNKASAPTVGTDVPIAVIPVPATSFVSYDFGTTGMRLATGIAFAMTGAIADADTTAVAAGDLKSIINYV